MFKYEPGRGFSAPQTVDDEIRRLERLAADLRQLRAGAGPGELTLARAPTIDKWLWLSVPQPAMAGFVCGHPTIPHGHSAATSEIWVDGRTGGWIRTRSRYYRLKTHFGKGIETDYAAH